MKLNNMDKPTTKFAIVNYDYTAEYVGTIYKDGEKSFHFVSRTIPHKGKRYKTFSNAVGVANYLNENGCICRVIETLI